MRMRSRYLALLGGVLLAQVMAAQVSMAPQQLVKEVVYNEQNDHEHHGYWRFWVERRSQQGVAREEQIETADGPVSILRMTNGQALDSSALAKERARLERLLHSPDEQSKARQAYLEDERRIGHILALLSDAFAFEDLGEENGCRHLRFHPNPDYSAKTIEARVFHAMSGELWLNTRHKRLARLDAHLEENLDFGFGILGRVYKGGWFRIERTQVSQSDWKTERLEVHMNGRAMLLKAIGHDTSEKRCGFRPVPARISLAEGMAMLTTQQESVALSSTEAGRVQLLHR